MVFIITMESSERYHPHLVAKLEEISKRMNEEGKGTIASFVEHDSKKNIVEIHITYAVPVSKWIFQKLIVGRLKKKVSQIDKTVKVRFREEKPSGD